MKPFFLIEFMRVGIKETDLKMFAAAAKTALTNHVQLYAEFIKEEAEKIAVSRFGSSDAKVTKEIIDGVIKLQGHYTGKRPSFFYSYVLPILEAVLGGLLCNALFKDDKTVWTGLIIASCILLLLGGVYLSYKREKQ